MVFRQFRAKERQQRNRSTGLDGVAVAAEVDQDRTEARIQPPRTFQSPLFPVEASLPSEVEERGERGPDGRDPGQESRICREEPADTHGVAIVNAELFDLLAKLLLLQLLLGA